MQMKKPLQFRILRTWDDGRESGGWLLIFRLGCPPFEFDKWFFSEKERGFPPSMNTIPENELWLVLERGDRQGRQDPIYWNKGITWQPPTR